MYLGHSLPYGAKEAREQGYGGMGMRLRRYGNETKEAWE